MADSTKIAWADRTWNPLAGCSVVSPACTNCYAMSMAARIVRMAKGRPTMYDGTTTETAKGKHVWTGRINIAPERQFLAPLRWKKPSRIFVNSMSDVFHDNVPDDVIDRIFAVMALCPQHTFMILTKRPQRMREYLSRNKDQQWGELRAAWFNSAKLFCEDQAIPLDWLAGPYFRRMPLPNVWLGVTCEDQKRADERIPDLLATPAAVRFVSAEPLLGPIDFMAMFEHRADVYSDTGIHWIITGGESGPERRNVDNLVDHIADIDRQCEAAGVAHFVKQDAALREGQQGRIPDPLWAKKQFPKVTP